MNCPHCGFGNPLEAVYCSKCGRQLLLEGATVTGPVTLAGRYEVLQLLGEGGMGAVYKARDRELDRSVALKVIRPELASDPEILQRFKQELILARKITHKNVIRIYDFGESEGTKFISMEYIDGQDLKTLLLERGRLPHEATVRIIQQVCRALRAAHSEGVVHRDLKPRNIMLDQAGNVFVMDFGIAHCLEVSGLTRVGALMGTPEYMSPEQAKGLKVDQRSDLFSLGIIFYELLTGQSPFQADNTMATLLKRTQEPAVPPVKLDASIPPSLSGIVVKCLQIDPQLRYQDAREILQDLESRQGLRTPTDLTVSPPLPKLATWKLPGLSARKWIAVGAVVLALLVLAGVVLWKRIISRPPAMPNLVTVLVADFNNHTGDPVFDGTLEPMFNVALEGASFINAFNRGEARKLARQLPHATEKLDEQSARLIAVSQGLGAIVTGSLSRRGDGYKLSVEAIDAVSGNTIGNAEVSVSSKDQVSLAIPQLAAPIRKALGDTTPESVQLDAARGAFTAASLEAVHQYGVALEQQFAGKMEEALRSFSKAAELDPNFARAYVGMAVMYRNFRKQQEAEGYFKLAMQHVDRMTERERYRTRGAYYLTMGNYQNCVEEYSTLINQYRSDNVGHSNLAICYSRLRNMPKAVEEGRRAVEISPKAAGPRMNLSLYASYAGDFQTGEREAQAAQQLNPSYEKSYLALAYAQLGQGQLPQAAETYRKLEKVSKRGASLAASGLADLAVYEGRFRDAARILEEGAAADLAAKNPESAAGKLAALAYTQLLRQQRGPALASLEKALANSKAVTPRFLAGRLFVAAGEAARARQLANGLASALQPEPQAYAKLIEGEIALQDKNYGQAIRAYTEANNVLDTWIGRLDLAQAYLEAGQFPEADSQLDRCIKRRGEAMELFVDDRPTYGYFPPVYYYLGRVREGLKSAGFAEFYRTYLSIRDKAGEDPLLAEVRRRAGQ